MSNPFDMFTQDIRAAVPNNTGPPPATPADSNPFGAQTNGPLPPGGAIPLSQPQMGMSGAPHMAGGLYGQQPPSGFAPPPQAGSNLVPGVSTSNALVPSNAPSNPYALGAGSTEQNSNPFGAAPPAQFGGANSGASFGMQSASPAGYGGQAPPAPYGSTATTNHYLAPGTGPFDVPTSGPPPYQVNQGSDPFSGGGTSLVAGTSAVPSLAGPFASTSGVPGPEHFPSSTQHIPPTSYADPFGTQPPQTIGGFGVSANSAHIPHGTGQGDSFATQPPAVSAGALVTSQASSDDPFGIFNTSSNPPPGTQAPTTSAVVTSTSDPWADMGLSPPDGGTQHPPPQPPVETQQTADVNVQGTAVQSEVRKDGELPLGGEWYDARIFTPTLGVMFFKPQELTDSLFLQTDRSIVDALDERPVVAFIVEGSSARSAGVELGHVLLKVNGIDVKNPKEASRLIKEGPRPLPLLFYVPDTSVVVAEGEHMVKYDTRETSAPNSAKDWKPKYVVIGGIIAQPWMMNMYRSKSEYDIAVIETQARRPVSVKVKQFSLQGARIQNDWQGPQMVKYKNKLHPWKYIVILPVARNPIKISSPNLASLKPVHEGIRRVLMAQQRGSAYQGPTAAPVRQPDPYGRGAPPDSYARAPADHYQRENDQHSRPHDQYAGTREVYHQQRDQYAVGHYPAAQQQYAPMDGGVSSVRRRQEY